MWGVPLWSNCLINSRSMEIIDFDWQLMLRQVLCLGIFHLFQVRVTNLLIQIAVGVWWFDSRDLCRVEWMKLKLDFSLIFTLILFLSCLFIQGTWRGEWFIQRQEIYRSDEEICQRHRLLETYTNEGVYCHQMLTLHTHGDVVELEKKWKF